MPLPSATTSLSFTASAQKRQRLDHFSVSVSPTRNTLEVVLTEDGHCRLQDNQSPYVIVKPHELRWSLERRLRSNPQLFERFVTDLIIKLDDDSAFRKALQPSMDSQGGDFAEQEGSFNGHQPNESLIRVLLGVPCLQERVCDIILDKLPEFAGDQDASSLWTDIPRLIIFQLRFLDNLYNESRLCEKLLALLSACEVSIQKEILATIPEILSDGSHEVITTALQSMLQDDVTLTVPILHTLSNLDLPANMIEPVREAAVNALETSPVCDLPVIIRFIMQSCTKKDVEKTMMTLIRSLRFIGSAQSNSGKSSSDNLLFVFEQLRAGVAFHNHVSSGFLKCLHSLEICDLSPVVIWLFLILNEQSAHFSKTATILRKWIPKDTQGLLPGLFQRSLSANDETINLTAKSAIATAEVALRSVDAREQDIGEVIYGCVFRSSSFRIDVLSSIVTHIGNGESQEADRALILLLQLSTNHPNYVLRYFTYLQGLLDFCHNLTNFQLRALFNSFAKCQGDIARTILAQSSDILIYIKKNFQQPIFTYQRAGIIGALCYINACVPIGTPFNDEHEIFTLLVGPLAQYTSKSHPATAFLCDEILYCLNQGIINTEVVDRLVGPAVQLFQDLFIVSLKDLPPSLDSSLVKTCTLFRLDPATDDDSFVSVLPTLSQPARRSAFQMLPSQLELLYRYSRCEENAALDEDGYSSMPLVLFDLECLDNLSEFDNDLMTLIFSALLHATNWFRSILNAFASDPDPILRWKCDRRLCHLLEIRTEFHRFSSEFVATVIPFGISQAHRTALTSQKDSKQKKSPDDILSHRFDVLLRPFVPAVYSLMILDLKLERACSENDERQAHLYLDTFLYLLQGFYDTLKKVPGKVLSSKSSNSHDHSGALNDYIDCIAFLEALGYNQDAGGGHFRVFRALGRNLVQLTSRENADCCEMDMVAQSIDIILQAMELITNCSHLQTLRGKSILFFVMYDFIQSDSEADLRAPMALITSAYARFLLQLIPLPFASIAIQVKICAIVHDLVHSGRILDSDGLRSDLSEAAYSLLTEYWLDQYKPGPCIASLVGYYITNANNPTEVVQMLISREFPRIFDDNVNETASEQDCESSPFTQTLTQSTWPYFFKACLEQIAGSLNFVEASVATFLKALEIRAKLFANLLGFVAQCQKRPVLTTAIRYGQAFMEAVVAQVPLMKREYKYASEEVIALINTVPKTTRMLQRICGHVKREKISGLTGKLPGLKKIMEKWLYFVKDLFHHHDLLHKSEFQCATLKNRTIDGREVRSSEDEMEEDDEGETETAGDQDDAGEDIEDKSPDEEEEEDNDGPSDEFHC